MNDLEDLKTTIAKLKKRTVSLKISNVVLDKKVQSLQRQLRRKQKTLDKARSEIYGLRYRFVRAEMKRN